MTSKIDLLLLSAIWFNLLSILVTQIELSSLWQKTEQLWWFREWILLNELWSKMSYIHQQIPVFFSPPPLLPFPPAMSSISWHRIRFLCHHRCSQQLEMSRCHCSQQLTSWVWIFAVTLTAVFNWKLNFHFLVFLEYWMLVPPSRLAVALLLIERWKDNGD